MANVEDAAVDGNTFSHLQGFLLEVAGLSHEYGVPEAMPAASPYNPSQPSHTQVDSSQGQEEIDLATFDLEDPYYLIKADGVPNTEKIEEYKKLTKYKFDVNFEEVKWRKTVPQIYSKELNMLLVTPNDPPKKPKNFIFWTLEEVPGGRLRFVVFRKDKKQQHEKVVMCAKDKERCGGNPLHDWPYILSANSVQYLTQQGHPVLVVPLEQSYPGKNMKTGEDGHCYPRELHTPCYTSHLDLEEDSVRLVVALEVPTQSDGRRYCCVGVTTVDICVCASPGRDMRTKEESLSPSNESKKKNTSKKRSATKDPSEDGPPFPKQERMAAVQSDAGCSSNQVGNDLFSDISSTFNVADCLVPALTMGMSSDEDPTSTVTPVAMEMAMHVNNDPSNADIMAKLNQLGAVMKQLLVQLASRPHEVPTGGVPIGSDTHSHTEQ